MNARLITTLAQLRDLPDQSVIRDKFGDVSERRGGLWCGHETAAADDSRVAKYLPATVLWEPRT